MRDWLKTMRCKSNYTQQLIAKKLGITQQYYNLIECNERQKELSISFAVKLSKIFNVSVEWIIEQEKIQIKEE